PAPNTTELFQFALDPDVDNWWPSFLQLGETRIGILVLHCRDAIPGPHRVFASGQYTAQSALSWCVDPGAKPSGVFVDMHLHPSGGDVTITFQGTDGDPSDRIVAAPWNSGDDQEVASINTNGVWKGSVTFHGL